MTIDYTLATTADDFETARSLFREYASGLAVDLCFQNFEQELKTITQQYAAPGGGLLIAWKGELPVGCAGIRRLDDESAELKRMYVRVEYRGYKIGVSLLEQAIGLAQELGYRSLRLDTLKEMHRAQGLYRSFGFREIPSYRHNPLEGTIYMEKELQTDTSPNH